MDASRYIRKSVQALHAYVPGEQPSDPDIIKLNTNENPYPPSPKVHEAIEGCFSKGLQKYPDPVASAVREQVAGDLGCRREQVIAGNGSDEVLLLCIRAFVEQDGSVGYFDPSYSLYPVLCAIEDVQVRPVSLHDDFSWNMPEEYHASLFFLTNPNAPTSLLFPRKNVEAFCRSFDGVVVIDEAYVDFAEADCMDLARSLPNVIVTRTLSKSASLAGIRFGYAVGPEPLIEALFKIKDSYNLNALTQAAALAALKDRTYTQQQVDKVKATRARLAEALTARGFEVCPSSANFLWARPGAVEAESLFQDLRKRGVFVRYFPGPKTGAHLRITVGTDDQSRRFLAVLDDILSA